MDSNRHRYVESIVDMKEREQKFDEKAKFIEVNGCNDNKQFLEFFKIFSKTQSECILITANIMMNELTCLKDVELQINYELEFSQLKEKVLIIQLNYNDGNLMGVLYKYPKRKFERLIVNEISQVTCINLFAASAVNLQLLLNMAYSSMDLVSFSSLLRLRYKKTVMECAVASNDATAVMMVPFIFDERTDSKILTEVCSQHGSVEILSLILNLHPTPDAAIKCLNQSIRDSLRKDFTSNYKDNKSLLDIVAERGKNDILDFIINFLRLYEFPLAYNVALQVSEYALIGKKFDNLLTLLNNDFPFPRNFENYIQKRDWRMGERWDTVKKLKRIYNARKEFHNALKYDNIENVKVFVEQNPSIKIGYLGNRSALHVALDRVKANKKTVYAFLLYHGFTTNDNDNYLNSLNLDVEDKRSIMKEFTVFYDRPVNSHLFFIFSKVRLGFHYKKQRQAEYMDKIKDFLDELNKIPNIVPILKILEYSRSLMIVFDFDHSSCDKIELEISDQQTMGICYIKLGHLYIGAKGPDKDVMGTLVHEMCHHAMNIIFKNNCKPFYKDDPDDYIFLDIVRQYRRMDKHEVNIIQRVFSLYSESDQPEELIVRVPEILIYYNDNTEQLDKIKNTYHLLFSYYEKHVLTKIDKCIGDSSFLWTCNVDYTNDRLGHLQTYQKVNIRPNTIIFTSQPNTFHVIVSNISKFTVKNIIERSELFILYKWNDLKVGYNWREIKSTYLQSNKIQIIIDLGDLKEINDEILNIFCGKKLPKKVFFVCEEHSVAKAILQRLNQIGQHGISYDTVEHSWNDLPYDMQAEILETEVLFQNHKIKLSELIDIERESDLVFALPLAKLVKGQFTKIGAEIPCNDGYKNFIERKFYNDTHSLFASNTIDVIAQSHGKKVVQLVDDAGMGKTTSLTHIAKQLKENEKYFWILRLNLCQHVDTFRTIAREKCSDVLDMIIRYFANITSPFEKILLSRFYEESKVILLLDGLDEICPELEKTFYEVLRQLVESSVKQIWITLRPHIQTVLKEKLCKIDNFVWKLKPFTKDNSITFIAHDWRSNLNQVTSDLLQKLVVLAENLINLLEKVIDRFLSELVGIPLQAKMVANIFFDEVRNILDLKENTFTVSEDFNLLWLYEEFMRHQINIVSNEKGDVPKNEKTRNELDSLNILELHEDLAIEQFELEYAEHQRESENVSKSDLGNKSRIEERATSHNLQRYGIVSLNTRNNNFDFIHFTYREYFVARFISRVFIESKMEFIKKAYYMLEKSFVNKVVLQFVDEFLKKSKKRVEDNVYKAIEKINDKNLLEHNIHFAIDHRLFNLLEFWMNSENYFTLKEIFIRHDSYGYYDYKYFPSRLLIEHIWNVAVRYNFGIKNIFFEVDSNFFFDTFLYPIKSEFHIVDEVDDIVRNRTLKNDDIPYQYYEHNCSLAIMYEKVKEILDQQEQQELLSLLHQEIGHFPRFLDPISAFYAKKCTKYFLNLRWKIYKEMSPPHATDVDLMAPEKFSKFLEFYANRPNSDDNLIKVYEWIHDTFKCKEIMLQCLQALYGSFSQIEKEQTFIHIMEIIAPYLNRGEFFANVPSNCDVFNIFSNGCPLRLLKIFSKVLEKDELINFCNNSSSRYHIQMNISVKYSKELDKLSNLVETYINTEIASLFREECELRAWILQLLLLFSTEDKDTIIQYIADSCSETLHHELIYSCAEGLKLQRTKFGFTKSQTDKSNKFLCKHIDNPTNFDRFFKYFSREKSSEVITVQLTIKFEEDIKQIELDAEITILNACEIIRNNFGAAVHGKSSAYGLMNWSDCWLQSDRKLRYYDVLYDLSRRTLEYKLKLRTLLIEKVNGDAYNILFDISLPVSQLIVVICTEIGLTNHEQYGLKSSNASSEHWLDIQKTLLRQRIDESKTLLFIKKCSVHQDFDTCGLEKRVLAKIDWTLEER